MPLWCNNYKYGKPVKHYARKAQFSIKLLCEMIIIVLIDVKLLKYELIAQARVKILRRPFRGRYKLEDYTF